jgi:hypothetical protein
MNIKSIVLSLLLLCLFSCDVLVPEKKEDNSALIGLLALAQRSGSTASTSSTGRFPIPTCEVSAPTFSTLRDAGFETTCGTSGCHITGTLAAARFRANSFSEVSAQTVASSPTTSKLYREQSTGTMAVYTTQAIDKAIYCWILGGSKP